MMAKGPAKQRKSTAKQATRSRHDWPKLEARILALASEGKTLSEISTLLGIERSTIWRRAQADPHGFATFLTRARVIGDEAVAEEIFTSARAKLKALVNGIHLEDPDTGASGIRATLEVCSRTSPAFAKHHKVDQKTETTIVSTDRLPELPPELDSAIEEVTRRWILGDATDDRPQGQSLPITAPR